MMVLRWLRSLARFALGISLLLPVIALPLSVWLDRGPAGEARISPHFFPLVLWLFDDFAWTCALQQRDFRDAGLAAVADLRRRAGVGCRSPSLLGAADPVRARGRASGCTARVLGDRAGWTVGISSSLALAVFGRIGWKRGGKSRVVAWAANLDRMDLVDLALGGRVGDARHGGGRRTTRPLVGQTPPR